MPDLSKHWLQVESPLGPNKLAVTGAQFEEGFNRLSRGFVEVASVDGEVDLDSLIGEEMAVVMKDPGGETRKFRGICVSLAALGKKSGYERYAIDLRSWFWVLSKSKDCRIFQEKSVEQIFDEITADFGFTDVDKNLRETHPTHEYVVQYRESQFDFLERILAEEGTYFYSKMEDGKETLAISDDSGSHPAIEGTSEVDYIAHETSGEVQKDHVSEWRRNHSLTSGNFALTDYNFKNPKLDLLAVGQKDKQYSKGDFEVFDYPGRYIDESAGNSLVQYMQEAETVQDQTITAVGNLSNIEVGRTFTLSKHPRESENGEYLVTRSRYTLSQELLESAAIGEKDCSVTFDAIPSDVPFRPKPSSPWPEISGVQTATVVGKSGEEIWTDEYGRVKVQFHWDRYGESNENSSCWVRCMMPWSGKGWGMVQLPRMGQEVVVQFEEGNPHRPVIVGMLYNEDTKPPYGFPNNQTKSGIVTRSTKSGDKNTFHELTFEDKKGEEEVVFQSERNYKQTIKNNAEITIGLEHKDKGDLTQTVHRHKTETIKTGDMTKTVEKGSEIREIATDQKEKIGSNLEQTVGSNAKIKIGADLTEQIGSNHKEKVGQALTIEAGTKIELKCGGSSITIEPAKITIKAVQVEVQGMAQTKVTAPMVQVQGSGMIQAQAPLIKLN